MWFDVDARHFDDWPRCRTVDILVSIVFQYLVSVIIKLPFSNEACVVALRLTNQTIIVNSHMPVQSILVIPTSPNSTNRLFHS